MGSPSLSIAVEMLNLGTCVMKDEDKLRLYKEEDGQNCEQFNRRWDGDLKKVYGWCLLVTFARSWPSISVINNISTCIISIQRSRDAASLLCHCKCMCEARERVTNSVAALHHAFLPCLWCRSGNVSLLSQCSANKNRPSHMHMIITICTSNVFCVGPS